MTNPNRLTQARRSMPALCVKTICEYFGNHPAQGNHTKCSKQRQADRRAQ